MSSVFIWSCCEPFIGIVCACLPTFAPLFRRWLSAVRSYNESSNGKLGSGGTDNHKTNSSFMLSKGSKRHWGLIEEGGGGKVGSGKLRSDDEVELTTEVTGCANGSVRTKGSTEDEFAMKNIVVKHDVTWESSHMDV